MRLVTLLCVLAASTVYADNEATTGSVAPLPPATRAGHLGGEGPQFILYLRADGALGDDGRNALSAALAALARLPGAGVDIYIEPADRDALSLADALSKPSDEMSRRALLVALARDDLTRATPSTALRFRRTYGALTQLPPLGMTVAGATRAGGMLRRPPGAPFAQRPFFALGDRKLDVAAVDTLVEADVWHTSESLPSGLERGLAAGKSLADDSVARICFVLPLRDATSEMLLEALKLFDLGRVRLRFEIAAPAPNVVVSEGEATLRRAFGRASPVDRVRLVRMLTRTRLPENTMSAIWLIQSANVDPAPLLADTSTPAKNPTLDPNNVFSVTVNAIPVSISDLRTMSRAQAQSVRQRLTRRRP